MAVLRVRPTVVLVGAALAAAAPVPTWGQVLTQEEALALAFPGAETERITSYLGDAELKRARELAGAGVEVESTVVTYYLARRGGGLQGVAYFDVHRVRTLPEVLMIVVGTDDRIRRIETVSFREPPEYRPPDRWLRVFDAHALDQALSLRGGIPNITGASLTSGAVTRAARRVLALHEVIDPFGGGRG